MAGFFKKIVDKLSGYPDDADFDYDNEYDYDEAPGEESEVLLRNRYMLSRAIQTRKSDRSDDAVCFFAEDLSAEGSTDQDGRAAAGHHATQQYSVRATCM